MPEATKNRVSIKIAHEAFQWIRRRQYEQGQATGNEPTQAQIVADLIRTSASKTDDPFTDKTVQDFSTREQNGTSQSLDIGVNSKQFSAAEQRRVRELVDVLRSGNKEYIAALLRVLDAFTRLLAIERRGITGLERPGCSVAESLQGAGSREQDHSAEGGRVGRKGAKRDSR